MNLKKLGSGIILSLILLFVSFTSIYADPTLTPTEPIETTPTITPIATPENTITPTPTNTSTQPLNLFVKPTFPTFPPLPTVELPTLPPIPTIPKLEIERNNHAVEIVSPEDQSFTNRSQPLEVRVKFNARNLNIKIGDKEKKAYLGMIRAVELLLNGKSIEVKQLKPAQKEGEVIFNVSLKELPEDIDIVQLQARIYEFYIPSKPKLPSFNNRPVAESDSITVKLGEFKVTWVPDSISTTIQPGTSVPVQVSFVSPITLINAHIEIGQEITDLFATSELELKDIPAGEKVLITFSAVADTTQSLGTFNGKVRLKTENYFSTPLSVTIIINSLPELIPDLFPMPISNRIIEDAATGQNIVVDEIIIGVDPEVTTVNDIKNIIKPIEGAVIIGNSPDLGLYQIQIIGATPASLESIIAKLEEDIKIDLATKHWVSIVDLKTPNDGKFDSWSDEAAGNNYHFELAKFPPAWDIQTGNKNIKLGIIDSGFDINHEDLKGNIVSAQDYLGKEDISGIIGGLEGYFHGTHVAGIAGAVGNNGKGVAGATWDTSLYLYNDTYLACKYVIGHSIPICLDRISSFEIMAVMMKRAIQDGVRIVNISQATDYGEGHIFTDSDRENAEKQNKILSKALLFAQRQGYDVLFTVAAANDHVDAKYFSPASLSNEFPFNVLTVASVDSKGNLSKFSNYGSLIDVAAPGDDIYSTFPILGYKTLSGTSMASPLVAGLGALLLSQDDGLTARQIKIRILAGARAGGKKVSGHDLYIINAEKSLKGEGTIDLPPKVDIVFSVDLTGSMGEEIDALKDELNKIITGLLSASPSTDFQFGLVTYEDYPGFYDSTVCSTSEYSAYYGESGSKPDGDKPFRVEAPVTTDIGLVRNKISNLTIGSGYDGPQSYARVLWESGQADSGIGFRKDALKLLINFGDNVPHDPNLLEDLSPEFVSKFADIKDTGIDPGRNGAIDCGGDDIDFQSIALEAMRSTGVKLLYIDSSEVLLPLWQEWASITGGAAVGINRDGSVPEGTSLAQIILDLVALAH